MKYCPIKLENFSLAHVDVGRTRRFGRVSSLYVLVRAWAPRATHFTRMNGMLWYFYLRLHKIYITCVTRMTQCRNDTMNPNPNIHIYNELFIYAYIWKKKTQECKRHAARGHFSDRSLIHLIYIIRYIIDDVSQISIKYLGLFFPSI